MTAWKVSHVFALPVEYESGPLNYPALGITLVGDGSAIRGMDHEFDADDRLSKAEVADLSANYVSLFVEVIRYRAGHCEVEVRSVSLRDPAPGGSRSTTTFTFQAGKAFIQRPMQFPPEANLASAPPRLRVWLRLAADAMQMSAPDAIRNYYMVWEDMGLSSSRGTKGEELRFIRNFVSHGGLLTKRDLLAFLEGEFHKHVNQYDPHDTDHQIFLECRRTWARNLLDLEICRYL